MRVNRGRESKPSEHRVENFTGEVWGDAVLTGVPGVAVNNVFFAPGGRTNWHRHAEGQILLVVQGKGYVRTADGDSAEVTEGDVVHSPAGELHWHGAAEDSYLLHTAISLGPTEWLGAVTDGQYAGDTEVLSPRP